MTGILPDPAEPVRICAVTGSRADFGLIVGLLRRLRTDRAFRLDVVPTDFGAQIGVPAEFALSHGVQATRRDTGLPRPVMMLRTRQPAAASVFCAGRLRARRPRPIT